MREPISTHMKREGQSSISIRMWLEWQLGEGEVVERNLAITIVLMLTDFLAVK